MKMLLVLPLTFVWMQSASATPIEKSVKRIPYFSMKTQKLEFRNSVAHLMTEPGPIAPIRQAQSRVTVRKTEYIKNPDGTYTRNEFFVCEQTPVVDVYDFSATGGGELQTSPGSTGTCATTFKGQAIDVNFFGLIAIGTGRVHESETSDSVLKVIPTIAYTANGSDWETLPQNSFITRDVGVSSIISYMAQPDYILCVESGESKPVPKPNGKGKSTSTEELPENCAPIRDESFSVAFEVID